MPTKTKTVMLKEIPDDVDRLIEKEQARIALNEEQRLKKYSVVYRMLREWYHLKNKELEFVANQKWS